MALRYPSSGNPDFLCRAGELSENFLCDFPQLSLLLNASGECNVSGFAENATECFQCTFTPPCGAQSLDMVVMRVWVAQLRAILPWGGVAPFSVPKKIVMENMQPVAQNDGLNY